MPPPLLARYCDRLCAFNDDILSTAAVAVATLMAAITVAGVPLTEQRIALVGAGSAGCGIAALLLRAMIEEGAGKNEARRHFYAVDRHGLLAEGMADITPVQAPFVQSKKTVGGWTLEKPGEIGLLDVVTNAGQKKPGRPRKAYRLRCESLNLPSSNFNHLSLVAWLRAVCVPRGTGSNRGSATTETDIR